MVVIIMIHIAVITTSPEIFSRHPSEKAILGTVTTIYNIAIIVQVVVADTDTTSSVLLPWTWLFEYISSLQGLHYCYPTRSDPRVLYTLFRHVRPRKSYTP